MRTGFDIVIVGGGMVGASLATALATLPLRCALIEAVPPRSPAQPSFDDRATAVSWGSSTIFKTIGVWPALATGATPIRRIHVSDRGRFGFTRIDCAEYGLPALGYVVENRTLGSALWESVRAAPGIETLAPARVRAMVVEDETVTLRLTLEDERERELTAGLVIAADGARSQIRELAGIGATTWDYDQAALVANLATQKPHHSIAFERFTDTGPLALLPMTHNRCNLVWTVPSAKVGELLELDEPAFRARLQRQFGHRLGKLRRVGERQTYPLALVRADEPTGSRVVFIGNAAQGLHPVAGQGFNLGLRDVAAVAEVLAEAIAAGGEGGTVPDLGHGRVLERYRAWRQGDRRRVVAFTDSLVRLFRNPLAAVQAGRNLGLLSLDLVPAAKQALARHAMGQAGRLPRLARGVPLT